jgi:hypothetical protein
LQLHRLEFDDVAVLDGDAGLRVAVARGDGVGCVPAGLQLLRNRADAASAAEQPREGRRR